MALTKFHVSRDGVEYIIQRRHAIGNRSTNGCRTLGFVRVRVLDLPFAADGTRTKSVEMSLAADQRTDCAKWQK